MRPIRTSLLALLVSTQLSAQSLRLEAAGRTVLADDAAANFGVASGLAVLSDGSYVLADSKDGVLLHLSRAGSVVRRIGRRGSGPMEWSHGPHTLHLAADSLLVVSDGPRVVVVSLPSWTQRAVLARPGALAMVAAADARRVAFSRVNPAKEASVAFVDIATSAVTDGGPFTAILRGGSQVVAQLMSFGAGTFLPDGRFAYAIQHSDWLFVGRNVAGPFDSVAVGTGVRRGSQAALVKAVRDAEPLTIERAVYRSSVPEAVAPAATAGFANIVYADLTMAGRVMTGSLFVARAALRGGPKCSDVAVPVPSDPRSIATLRGDTLFVLTQREVVMGDVQTAVERYVIRPNGC